MVSIWVVRRWVARSSWQTILCVQFVCAQKQHKRSSAWVNLHTHWSRARWQGEWKVARTCGGSPKSQPVLYPVAFVCSVLCAWREIIARARATILQSAMNLWWCAYAADSKWIPQLYFSATAAVFIADHLLNAAYFRNSFFHLNSGFNDWCHLLTALRVY